MKTPLAVRLCGSGLVMLLSLAPGQRFAAMAQEMHHAVDSKPSTDLQISVRTGASLRLTPSDFKALPHKTVSVVNGHSKVQETYSGVLVSDLLSKLDVPLGEKLKGKLLLSCVIAGGTDGYAVVYALAEIDPAMHMGEVIVADSVNGAPLDKDGAFKLISTEDKRPARWVRNLNTLTVTSVEGK